MINLRQIYIQGPPENVAKAKLLVSSKVPIQSFSTSAIVHYYPVSFPFAETLRKDNDPFLQEVSKVSGTLISIF